MAGTFAGVLTGNSAAGGAPSKFAGTLTGNTKPPAAGKFGGVLTSQQSPIAPKIAPVSPLPAAGNSAASTPSDIPASALAGNLGGGYGTSNILDMPNTKSANNAPLGKPLLTFENPVARASQLLEDRVAPTFDPSKPQKIDPATLENGRMPKSASDAVRKATGAQPDEQLDHLISLELGGSNDTSNLNNEKLQSNGTQPSLPFENQLAKDVASGKISYIEGQKQIARLKGVKLPDDTEYDSSAHPLAGGYPKPNSGAAPATASPISAFFSKVNDAVNSSADKVFSALGGDMLVHPVQTVKNIGDQAFSTAKDTVGNLAHSAAQVVANFQGNRSAPEKAASVLSLLSSAASTALLPATELFGVASQLPVIKPAADAVGLIFDTAGKVTSFAPDKLLASLPIPQSTKDALAAPIHSVSSLAGQIALGGYVYGKITGAMEADPQKVIDDAAQKAKDLNTVSAWQKLGSPATMEEAHAKYLEIMHDVHPDLPGGDAGKASEINQAYATLNQNGIPSPELMKMASESNGELLYHGTDAKGSASIQEKGIVPGSPSGDPYLKGNASYNGGLSLSRDKSISSAYGEHVFHLRLSPDAKIAKYDDVPKELFHTFYDANIGAPAKDGEYKTYFNQSDAVKWARANGYDGIDLEDLEKHTSDPSSAREVQVWNKDVLKNETQLSETPKSEVADSRAGFANPSELIPSVVKSGAEAVGASASEIKTGILPASASDKAMQSADLIREAKAKITNESTLERYKNKDIAAKFDRASDNENIGNISEYERTGKFKTAPPGYSELFSKSMDESRATLQQAYGDDRVGYVENYVRRAFKFGSKADEEKATSFLTNKTGSLSANKSNIKGRVLDMPLDEALANMKARGIKVKLTTTNPELLRQWSVENAKQALAYKEVWTRAKETGLIKFVKPGERVPDDLVPLSDRVAKVFFPTDAGLVKGGQYYADKSVARIFDNAISKGLGGSPTYQGIRAINNAYNQVQLGFSAFHLTGTAINAGVSDLALGLRQILNGDFKTGATSIGRSAVPMASFVRDVLKGKGLINDLIKDDPVAKKFLETKLNPAGGRLNVDSSYQNTAYERMLRAWKNGEYTKALGNAPFAVVQKVGAPLMEYAIPRVKLGAFMDLAEASLARLPADASDSMRQRALSKAWDSVDNRFGQLTYDNLFWNKTLSDLAHVATRSVGWNLGTVRELGGGLGDVARDTARGKGISDRTLYALALPLYAGAIGAIYQLLHTGKRPTSFKDYFYPQNGAKDANGNPDRASLPTYMKDVYAYSTDPVATVEHKASPLVSLMVDLATNSDYYGNMIKNPDDSTVKQLEQQGQYAIGQFLPFTVQQLQQMTTDTGSSIEKKTEPFFGFTKAPGSIVKSDKQLQAEAAARQLHPGMVMTPEQQQIAQQKSDARAAIRKGDYSKLDALIKAGIVKPKGRKQFVDDALKTSFQKTLDKLPASTRQNFK